MVYMGAIANGGKAAVPCLIQRVETAGLPALPYLHVLGAGEAGLAVLQQAKQAASLPLSASLAVLEKASLPAAQVAALHAAAEDFAALCLASPRPMGTAYTQKFIAPPKG